MSRYWRHSYGCLIHILSAQVRPLPLPSPFTANPFRHFLAVLGSSCPVQQFNANAGCGVRFVDSSEPEVLFPLSHGVTWAHSCSWRIIGQYGAARPA
ncbi:hypothetical protein F5141DRAFT_665318 [Pisolithus sp. B1]|nr:hypothetical protein F5141DRAFT_665318 [Pisolithus sp. B1]